MYPWICLKCGKFSESMEGLLGHIREEGHQLTEEELTRFAEAMMDVARALGIVKV